MDNSKNMEPGVKDAAVQDSTNKEQRKKESRPVISAKAQTVLDFLRACSPYEADSIRVMVGYGTGKGDIGAIEATDMLAVNRFLNHGLAKENGTSGEAVMKHRQERAQKLMEAVKAVFRSWDNPRANVYRRMNEIPYDWGTAVNVQSMVFGNSGDNSGTGVAFTRNPATGEKALFGEYLINAQGEDVVAGVPTLQTVWSSIIRTCRTWSLPSRTANSICSRPATASAPPPPP